MAALAASLVASGLFVGATAPASAATRAFTPIYTTNTTGDVMIRGNSLETCPAGSFSAGSTTLSCTNVQNGTSNGVNNNFFMSYVDTDSDATTFNSSSATVTIPTGATVLSAVLTWSGTTAAGSLANYPALTGAAAPNSAIRNTVKFMVPGGTSYSTVTSAQAVDSTGSGYQGFKDVTAAVQGAGSGPYTVANVQAGTGGNDYAGWALAVAYRDTTQPVRNLVIYSGFTNVTNGATTSIPITGFTTPLTGPVVTRLGAVVFEGDRGNIGDTMTLGSNAISNTLNPVTDVENSSVSDLGVAITDRTPAYSNTLGLDIDRFDATGFFTNGQTSTTITLKTVGDGYYPGVVSLATNLYSPSLQATKTVKDVTNGIASTVKAGDVLAYSMAITNVGGDGSTSSILTDAVPTGATYVAGSLVIGGTAATDASGDDAGNVSSGTVTARLGTGATATAGGALATSASTTVAFNVTVNAGAANGAVVANTAALGYTSATTGKTFIGASNPVSTTVSVINVNPVLAFPAPPSGEVSASYTNTLTAAGGTAPYTWAVTTGALPTGLALNATTGVVSGTPTTSGIYTFTVSATDANAQVATETTSIYVAPQPVLAYPTPLQNADTGNAYSYALGVNPGTGPYVWSVSVGTLPAGLTLDSATGLISGTPTVAGTVNFTVRVVDAFGASATEATRLTVLAGPTLNDAAPPVGDVGDPYNDQLAVVGGTSPYIWTVSTGTLPAGITLDSASGLLSGTPTAAGTSNFTVTVTDVNGATASEATTITIVPAPTLTGTLAGGELTAPYSSGLTVNNGVGPYVWSISTGTLPAGLTLNTSTGLITGTPTGTTSTITVQVSDSNGVTATRSQSLVVTAGPAVTFTPPRGEIGISYTAQPTVTGGTGPYTWSISAGTLPAGLSINTTAGAITGTPTATGTPNITVQATDANGGTSTQARTLTIAAAPTLSGSLAAAELTAPYSSGFTVNNGVGPYVWSISTGTVPAGLTLNTSTGVITGTPTGSSSTFTVQVSDAYSVTATRSGTINVGDGPVVTFTAPAGEIGISYTAQPTASGGSGPYTWSISSGTLPAGLTLNTTTGAITGTPTAAGTPNITVQATDANGGTATQAVNLTIVAAPALTFPASLSGQALVAYSRALSFTGGLRPFVWSISSGGLPDGLTIDPGTGLLSGTPTTVGSATFTVRVVDKNGLADTRAVTMDVSKATSTVSLSASDSVRFGTAVTLTATVGPSSPTGTVTVTDVPSTGPQAGNTVTLGSGTVSDDGTASVTVTLPAFGVNQLRASYSGDATHSTKLSSAQAVEVSAFAGQVIVTEFRSSGPAGGGDSYVELLNTGPTVPLAGLKVTTTTGSVSTLPDNAGLLGTGRSYLLTGPDFSLGATATSDFSTALGSGGISVTAPDTAVTQTDAVGPAGGFHLGTNGLPELTGTPAAQYAWVRTERAGAAVDSRDNAADFQLVSTTLDQVGGQQPTLGSPSPTGTADPYQHNSALQSTLLDPDKGASSIPNRVSVRGTPGRLTVRRTITNSSNQTISSAKVRVSALSEQFGAPQPGVSTQPARVAQLRVITPLSATEQIRLTSGTTVNVQALSLDDPNGGVLGGGLNSTLTVPLPDGGLAPNASVNVAFSFAVDARGSFWFSYDVDATTSIAPSARRATTHAAGRSNAHASAPHYSAAADNGRLR